MRSEHVRTRTDRYGRVWSLRDVSETEAIELMLLVAQVARLV